MLKFGVYIIDSLACKSFTQGGRQKNLGKLSPIGRSRARKILEVPTPIAEVGSNPFGI